ncbi:hypothetical protein ACRAWG_06145 [Methylobacterium sp. P31]
MLYDEVGRQSNEAISLGVRLTEKMALLSIAIPYAWFDAWGWYFWQFSTGFADELGRQARTSRLIRRGVPPEAAVRRLRVV